MARKVEKKSTNETAVGIEGIVKQTLENLRSPGVGAA